MEARYLRVKNWDRFQHYHNRPNPPHWIKSYPALLDDYNFRQLPEIERGRLMCIWLLAGRLRNRLPYDPRYIAQVIGAKKVNLDMFVALGWLEVIDEHGSLVDPEPLDDQRPTSTPGSRRGSMPEEKREEREIDKRAVTPLAVHFEQPPNIANIIDLSLKEGAA